MSYPSAPPANPPTYNQIVQENKNFNYPQMQQRFNAIHMNQINELSFEQRFQNIIQKHEISQYFAGKLFHLNNFKVVFIFDDSGSMNTVLQESPLNKNNNMYKATRWDELQYFANISIEIASIFNPDEGCDVYFLNRSQLPARGIVNSDQIKEYFRGAPHGFTPLSQTLYKVLEDYRNRRDERKLLVIICTDGEPTDVNGKINILDFRRCLETRPLNVFTTIAACTDDDESMNYLNNWDKTLPRLDIIDDFRSERDEIKRIRGPYFSFSFGDYVVKSLVGSIDHELDNLDQSNNTQLNKHHNNNVQSECCQII